MSVFGYLLVIAWLALAVVQIRIEQFTNAYILIVAALVTGAGYHISGRLKKLEKDMHK